MHKILGAVYAAVIISAVLTAPSMAQVQGSYAGTSADGNDLTFTVATDTHTGELAVTSAVINFTAPCRNSSVVLNSDWGFGLNSDITRSRKVFITAYGNYFRFDISLDFAADGQSATGTILSTAPTLDPVGNKPTKALFCTSPKQTLTLALQPNTGAVPAALKVGHSSPHASEDSPVETSH